MTTFSTAFTSTSDPTSGVAVAVVTVAGIDLPAVVVADAVGNAINVTNAAPANTAFAEVVREVTRVDGTIVANITALNGTVQLATAGRAGGLSFTTSGTFSATYVVEISGDGGTTWTQIPFYYVTIAGGSLTWAKYTSNTSAASYQILPQSMTHVRVRASVFTSGTLTVQINATEMGSAALLQSVCVPEGGSIASGQLGLLLTAYDPNAGTTRIVRVAQQAASGDRFGLYVRPSMPWDDSGTGIAQALKAASASAVAADPAAVVTISPNSASHPVTASQGTSPWVVSGPVTLATGAATIGSVVIVTGSATLGQMVLATGAATAGAVQLVTGATNLTVTGGFATLGAIILVTGTATIGQVAQATSPWVISGPVTLATGAAVIGALTSPQGVSGTVVLGTGTATIGQIVLATGAAVIGALATGSATIGQVLLVTGAATVGQIVLATGAAVVGALSANQSVTVGAVPANMSVSLVAIGGIAVTAVTIGVQGVQAVPTQPLRDSGRSYRTFTVVSVTGVTTEALLTMNINSSGTVTTGTTYTVTSGKRLRLQAANLSVVDQSATAVGFAARMTVRVAATVTVGSAALLHLQTGTPGITAASVNNGGGAGANLAIPDGIEIPAGQQLGMSHLETGTTGEITSSVIGYEY